MLKHALRDCGADGAPTAGAEAAARRVGLDPRDSRQRRAADSPGDGGGMAFGPAPCPRKERALVVIDHSSKVGKHSVDFARSHVVPIAVVVIVSARIPRIIFRSTLLQLLCKARELLCLFEQR